MFSGFLVKRTTIAGTTTILQRSFCVIWGTLLLDYENEDEFKNNMVPKSGLELLGVSEWDGGQIRQNKLSTSFLVVSHTGMRYYMTAISQTDRNDWILHIRKALECSFANIAVTAYKPSKLKRNRPKPQHNRICSRANTALSSNSILCKSCGRSYSSTEFVQDQCPFIQIGIEDNERCCSDCKNAQAAILWLKSLNYVHVMSIHDYTPEVHQEIVKYEASFELRKRQSRRLQMAGQLLEQSQITAEEFDELRRIDHEYGIEKAFDDSSQLGSALDALGEDMLMVIGMLTNPTTTDAGGRAAYFQVIMKLLSIADKEPSVVDFYLPQVMQAHLQESSNRTVMSLIRVDLMQQALLCLCAKYPPIALKITWMLIAVTEDYSERRVSQCQYASAVCLLMQIDKIVNGSINCLVDSPSNISLATTLQPAIHQKLEIDYEICCLFSGRCRLHELCDLESLEFARIKAKCPDSPAEALQSLKNREFYTKLLCEQLSGATLNQLGQDGKPAQSILSGNEYFRDQVQFSGQLSELVESLRFIHRQSRSEVLCRELSKWNDKYQSLGWDPTRGAGEPMYKIVRLVVEDCRVFRTKARAPSLIVCEVLRQDFVTKANFENSKALQFIPQENDKAEGQQNNFRKRTTSILLPDGIDATHLRINDGIDLVDGLVDLSISQVIADMQRSKELAEITPVDHDSLPDLESTSCTPDITSEFVESEAATPSESVAATETLNSQPNIATQAIAVFQSAVASANSPSKSGSHRANSQNGDLLRVSNVGQMFKRILPKSPISAPIRTLSPFALSGDPLMELHGGLSNEFSRTTQSTSSKRSMGALLSANRKAVYRLGSLSKLSGGGSIPASGTPSSGDTSQTKLVVESANKLLKEGKIDKNEYEMLVKCDDRYRDESARVDEELTMTRVESAYGESWAAKRERILGDRLQMRVNAGQFPLEQWPIWDLRSFIVKSNDDLRQEVCCLQVMQLCKEVFEDFGLSSQLWLNPGRIISTGRSTGIVQVIPDSMSLDALKKTSGFVSLPFFFRSTYGTSAERLNNAKKNFMASLAAYSLFCYIFMVKDRHNGNILLDVDGHIIHIDFGFMLSIAPGGAFSLESAPFKLTEEMVEVLGGLESKLFGEFVKSFTAGFLALRANAESIISTLQILSVNSPYPCFQGKDSAVVIDKLRTRFRNELSVKDVVQHCLDLIIASYGNYGTKQYDAFQWYTNGIVA